MKRKPLPQFKSLQEAKDFYGKYGRLEYFGRIGQRAEICIYVLHVIDGRKLDLKMYDDGKVEYLDIPKRS